MASGLENIETIESPFRRFVTTIGVFPTAFTDAMTYYECLAYLVKYLEETVIPAVNENAEALAELQDLFVQLKSYVDHYFDNLDIQEEIDNKLDQMAASGQLADIIAQYLKTQAIFGFDTIADMSASDNLVNGAICKVLGKTSYKAGDGGFYKIRTITSDDVIDGVNIVKITHDSTLIAERITDKPVDELNASVEEINTNISLIQSNITTIESNVDNLDNNVNTINQFIDEGIWIFISDSYGVGTTASGTITGWCDRVKEILKISDEDYIKSVEGGAGFVTLGSSGNNFEMLLSNITVEETDRVKHIIVAGGYNDWGVLGQISGKIDSFCNIAKTKFPNAQIKIGFISNNGSNTDSANVRKGLRSVLEQYQLAAVKNGTTFLKGCENILHDYDLISSDNIHPTDDGYNTLSQGIAEAIKDGSTEFIRVIQEAKAISTVTSNSFSLYSSIMNDSVSLKWEEQTLTFSSPQTLRQGFTLGQYKVKNFRYCEFPLRFPIQFYLITNDSKFYGGVGFLELISGNLVIYPELLTNDGSGFVTANNVSSIHINAGSYTLSTLES